VIPMSTSSAANRAANKLPLALATTTLGGVPRPRARMRQDQELSLAEGTDRLNAGGQPAALGRVTPVARQKPRAEKPRSPRGRGDDGIHWDKTNRCYVGTISLGFDPSGKRVRRTVRGATTTEVKEKLDELHDEIKAGIRTPATYTVEQCVRDWLDSLTLDPGTVENYRRQVLGDALSEERTGCLGHGR
jgi:hypothetical protein